MKKIAEKKSWRAAEIAYQLARRVGARSTHPEDEIYEGGVAKVGPDHLRPEVSDERQAVMNSGQC